MKRFFIKVSLVLFVFGVALLLGCASILAGKKQVISVTSNVQGADVYIVDLGDKNKEEKVGVTPFNGIVSKIKNAKIKVSKEGYKTAEVIMNTEVETVFWLNILSGGTTGSSTDYSTSAMWKYSPNTFLANLEPEKRGAHYDQFKKESLLRVFVVMNFDRINNNITLGKGEYLNALYEIFSVKTDSEKAELLKKFQKEQKNSYTIDEFASNLISLM